MLRLFAGAAAAIVVFLGASPSRAADTAKVAFAPTTMDGYIVTVKGNVLASNRWQGADPLSVIGYPSLSFRKAGEKPKFSSPDDGIGFALFDENRFSAGLVFRYKGGRYDGSDTALRGIHDVRWTVESGGFVEAWVHENIRLRAELRRGFREKDGFAATLGADLVKSFNNWTVALGPRLAFADGSYMRHNFGVTARDAALNPRVTAYQAKSGLKSVGLYASATYQFNQAWAATVHGGYDRLVGSAAKSPITTNIGSKDQFAFGLTLSYSFPVKGF